MSTQQPQHPQPQEQSIIEFTPFGTKDKIQLSIQIVKRLIAVKTKSGKTCTDEEAFKFMLMCQARHLNPFEGDAFLIGYDGQAGPSFSLITAHQAFLKRAELHPEFDGMQSGTIVLREAKIVDLIGDWHMPTDKILGGWATVYFKSRTHPMTKRVRLERFNKGFGVWRDDPAGMIVKCAEADALRSSFPTMLGGMYTQEEMGPSGTDTIPKPVFAETVNGDAAPADRTPPEPVAPTPPPEPPKAKKKPTLQRRSVSRSEPPQPKRESHDKMMQLLAVGGYTPEDFVRLAVDEGWITLEQGSWANIPESKVATFLEPANWELVMQMLDERKPKADPAPATAGSGQLL
jgi:phage recombination protein Bet